MSVNNSSENPAFLGKVFGVMDGLQDEDNTSTSPAIDCQNPAGVPVSLDNLHTLLPAVAGKKVVDLCCGDGWFSRWATEQGAAAVQAYDGSESMVQQAIQKTQGTENSHKITFEHADLNDDETALDLAYFGVEEGKTYDLAFSCLGLHYLKDLPEIFEVIYDMVAPNGSFFFSIEHPMRTAPKHPGLVKIHDNVAEVSWPVANYREEGERMVNCMGEEVIKQHRTLEAYFNGVVKAGFQVIFLREWGCKRQNLKDIREQRWMKAEDIIPAFVMIGARKV
ncbi:S-adenosyl-L-methionine-dependent methyltransferase [Xylariaceae sp. FL0255]|nr:S-adenosyl-L-methionine-dependent methyltransferase [Xylariaceae sp. FL0255]